MINKFQQGGQAEQDQQLNILAQAMVQLQQLGAAAEQGDQQAQAIMQEIQKRAQAMAQQAQQPAMAKCGAKLHKKGEQGLKLVKKAECGCKAKLKRVGGKLVNVDCNGNIVK
jgi:hypothetical protein